MPYKLTVLTGKGRRRQVSTRYGSKMKIMASARMLRSQGLKSVRVKKVKYK